ncbi:Rsm22-domain-containing protein [Rhodotorula sp. JG-1b]|nr:Rsm22-domain-containing protein [Rhodotorula sp. JG-1b]
MFVRSARASTPVAGRRHAASSALDRRSLDVYARARQDQLQGDNSSAPISRSGPAKRGKVPRADVALPEELDKTVTGIINGMDNKRAIHDRAVELYRRLRHTSGPQTAHPGSERLHFDVSTSIAYLAGIMPAVYTATLSVLEILQQRLELLAKQEGGGLWQPDRLVDYGSGTGSAAWAFERVFGVESESGARKEYVGFEMSRPMLELSSGLFGAIPLRHTADSSTSGQLSPNRLDARAHHIQVPVAPTTLAKMQLAPNSYADKRTIALAAFSLGDLGRSSRKELVQAMWNSGAEYMVLIDRGTPRGSRMVIEARDQLLAYGRREVHRARGVDVEDQVDFELHAAGLEIVPEGVENVGEAKPVDPSLGSHVIAPCPHDSPCPMSGSVRGFCHFSRRLQIPDFLQKTKGTKRGEDDAKYSYVIVRRGQRLQPQEPERPSAFAEMLASLDASRASSPWTSGDKDESSVAVSAVGSAADHVDPVAELAWSRIVAPPSKGSGHVTLDMCASSGEIERHVISKRLGRQPYYDARKSAWGDSFPHAAHNGPMPSPLTAESTSTLEQKPQNKFGGDFKERSVKADRQRGREAAQELRMGARRARSMRREYARERREYESRQARSKEPDEHGVVEYELDAQGNVI